VAVPAKHATQTALPTLTNPELHPLLVPVESITVVEVHLLELTGHKTQADETNEYPVTQAVGIAAEVVHADAPTAVQAVHTEEITE